MEIPCFGSAVLVCPPPLPSVSNEGQRAKMRKCTSTSEALIGCISDKVPYRLTGSTRCRILTALSDPMVRISKGTSMRWSDAQHAYHIWRCGTMKLRSAVVHISTADARRQAKGTRERIMLNAVVEGRWIKVARSLISSSSLPARKRNSGS